MGGYDGAELVSNGKIEDSTWTHVAWVADGDTWRLYINGNLDAQSTGHTNHLLDAGSADGFVIGNTRSNNPNGASKTYFAEARVWKCARTTAEIQSAMSNRIENAWCVKDLIGYWPLNDGAADYALNGNKARNYAGLEPKKYTPSGAEPFNYSYAKGNRVGWVVAPELPVAGTLHGEQYAICNAGSRFNAVDTQVSDIPDDFTFMGWYLVNSSRAGLDNELFDKMKVASGRLRFHETNGALRFWMGGATSGSGGPTSEEFVVANCMPIGQWTHVALTKRRGTVKIYVNGEQVGENNAFTMDLCDANLHIGGFDVNPDGVSTSSGGFNGAFRNVGFWSRVMGPASIKNYMFALPAANDDKLIGYWPLDDGAGNSVSNLKAGASAAVPVSNGSFLWAKRPNNPYITDPVQPEGMMIFIR